jgi:sterol desaturase/sphingolipid hydroxylase (fatty acid hydroxylase superfamily)
MYSWILSFLGAYVGQAVGTLALFGLIFLVTRRWAAGLLSGRRISTRGSGVDRSQLFHEVRHSLVVFAVGSAQAVMVQTLHESGGTKLIEGLGPWGLVGAIGSFLGLILFNDLWFYSMHRLLHTSFLYKHIHSVHHRSIDVNPFSSYSFHLIEAILVTGWVLPAALYIPFPMPVLMVTQVVGLANNLMAHLGYELLPRWWAGVPILRWSNSATFHSMHHTRFKGNYGLFSRVWDRLFGTELDQYEETFARAHPPKP